ncbi:MAG: PQQ-binding-like beta-propeller repeat protein, partial [Bacteroidia bacterium]
NRLIAKKEWSFKAKGGIQGSYAIKGDSIYFLSDGKELISLNRINGDLNWEFNTKGEAGVSGVTIDNEEIYIACGNGYVYKLKE